MSEWGGLWWGGGLGRAYLLKFRMHIPYDTVMHFSLPGETLCWAHRGLFGDVRGSLARQSEMETAFMPSAGEWLRACWHVYHSS